MQTLKEVFTKQCVQVYRTFSIPLIIFIVALTAALCFNGFFNVFNKINSDAESFVREIISLTNKTETKYNALLKEILEEYFHTGYDLEAIQKMKQVIRDEMPGAFQVTEINYYRLDENFYIYDTDFPPDLGRDFEDSSYFQENLSILEPGEIFLDILNVEGATGDTRLYAYTRMPDKTYFEFGVKFLNVKETIVEILDKHFQGYSIGVHIFDDFPPESGLLMEQSLEKGEPVFKLNSFSTASFYVAKVTEYGNYKFLINITFYYPLLVLLIAVLLTVLLLFLKRRVDRKMEIIVEHVTETIETLERNVKKVHITDQEIDMEEITTDIMEIKSIEQSFLEMRDNIVSSFEEMSAMNEELETSYLENQTLLNKVEALLNVPDYLLYLNNMEKFLLRSFEKILTLISETDFGYVAVVEEGLYHFLDFRGLNVQFVNGLKLEDSVYLRAETVILNNYEPGEYRAKYPHLTDTGINLGDIAQTLSIPIQSDNDYYGSITLSNKHSSGKTLTDDDYRIAAFFANYLRGYLMIKELSADDETLQKETISSLIRLLEQHDPYTRGHSESVARLASNFAYYLGLTERDAQSLYWAGIVHDMGKILIPHSILNKPTRLTSEEFEKIKNHPVYAWDVLRENHNMERIAIYIKHHHEKYDGTGYPDGLKGTQIPYESRILSLADAWDAMTSERVYKKGMPVVDAIREIKKNSGVQFDPELAGKWVDFIKADSEFKLD